MHRLGIRGLLGQDMTTHDLYGSGSACDPPQFGFLPYEIGRVGILLSLPWPGKC